MTARLNDRLVDVARRARAAGQRWFLVLNEREIVLGRVRESAFDGDPDAYVEDVMEPGPTTARPDTEAEALSERLRRREIPSIVITTSDGRLLGTFRVDEVQQDLEEHEDECCLCSS